MSLILLSEFPPISDEQSSVLAFHLDESNVLWIAYEAARDFLSAPRPFVILTADLGDAPMLSTCGALLSESQWNALDEAGVGLYELDAYADKGVEAEKIFVCKGNQRILDFASKALTKVNTLYHHHPSSQAALLQQLQQND